LTGRQLTPFTFNEFKELAIASRYHCTNTAVDVSDPGAWNTCAIRRDSFESLVRNPGKRYSPLGADLILIPATKKNPQERWAVAIYIMDNQKKEIMRPVIWNANYAIGAETLALKDISTLTEEQLKRKIETDNNTSTSTIQ
jgi:hypothetical protein